MSLLSLLPAGTQDTSSLGLPAGWGGSAEDLLTRSFGSSRLRVEGVLAIYN